MTIQELIDETLKLDAEATSAPWVRHSRNPFSVDCEEAIITEFGGSMFRSTSYGKMREDASLIAGYRSVAPKLAMALQKCREQRDCRYLSTRQSQEDDEELELILNDCEALHGDEIVMVNSNSKPIDIERIFNE